MAKIDDGYSRAIAVVKILLPLVALGILSTLFLFARPEPQGQPLPYSEAEVGELAREERLGRPVLRGINEGGARYSVTAERVRPEIGQEGIYHATQIEAEIDMQSGYGYDLSAPDGTMYDRDGRATLRGGVRVVTTDGYVITMPEARLKTDLTYLEGDGPVRASGPLGQLEAGSVVIRGNPNTGSEGHALFKGGVKLVYVPQGDSRE